MLRQRKETRNFNQVVTFVKKYICENEIRNKRYVIATIVKVF